MKKIIVMLLMISLSISLFSQFKLDLKYSDTKDTAGTVLVCASAVAAAYFFDEQIRLTVPKIENLSIDSLTDAKISLGISSALLISSFLFDSPEFKDVAFRSFQAGAASAAVGYLLKHATGRARPFMEEGKNSFMGLAAASDNYLSFPSGHSIVAWAVVTKTHFATVGGKCITTWNYSQQDAWKSLHYWRRKIWRFGYLYLR